MILKKNALKQTYTTFWSLSDVVILDTSDRTSKLDAWGAGVDVQVLG